MSKKLRLALIKQIKPVLSQDYTTINKETLKYLLDNKPLKSVLIELHKKSAQLGYKKVAKDLFDDIIEQQMLIYAEEIAGKRITWLTKETERLILDIVQGGITQGTASGWGRDKIARYIRTELSEQYGTISRYRSVMIAQTDINASVNYGSLTSAMNAGVPMRKTWVSGGADSRPAHLAAMGITVGMDEVFIVGGEKLRYPGDSSLGASAGNVINCFTGDQLTRTPIKQIKKIYRSLYNGKVITIKVSNGNNFTCTPNHPILTSVGWVNAQNINQTHNIIKSSFIESHFSNFNVNNKPVSFDQLYNSISKIGVVMRMPGVDVNFHGDIPDSDVDIISVKRFLRDAYKSKFSKIINSIGFKLSNFRKSIFLTSSLFNCGFMMKRMRKLSHSFISFFDYLSFFINSGIFKSNNVCLASASNMNFIHGNYPVNNIPGNMEMFTEAENTITRIIHVNDEIIIDSSLCLKEDVVSVVAVSVHDFKGYVYTLETTHQMYEINSIIARNCRCRMVYERINIGI
jgi:hypothetical protein